MSNEIELTNQEIPLDAMVKSVITDEVVHSDQLNEVVDGDGDVSVSPDMNTSPGSGPTRDSEDDALEATETGRGRPPHLPNADTRKQVYELSSVGTTYEDIAKVLSISPDTLTKYYRPELDRGRIDANAIIAGTLFKQAQEGNTSAMIFWLKTRARWKEVTQHEISGNPDGTPVQVKVITGID